MKERVTIIGAGIGGLTMALALKQRGIDFKIYESADEIKPVGAGIIMANNAMQIFKKLGIQKKIEEAGNKVEVVNLTDKKLRILSSMHLTKYESRYGVYNVAIHRADLQKILAAEIGNNNIELSKRLIKIEAAISTDNPKMQSDMQNNTWSHTVRLSFEDNTAISCDMVIGADGINSTIRNQVFAPSELRDANQMCWRGISETSLPSKYDHEAFEAWGNGKRFGFVKINKTQWYWYAVISMALIDLNNFDLLKQFSGFHPDILSIIETTTPDSIFRSNLADLKPIKNFYKGNICLIGDAAHATTPNLGQGACQAVEDAYAISNLFANHKDAWLDTKSTEQIFNTYQSLRMHKAHDIVRRSRGIGEIAHIKNPVLGWLRNNVMKLLPDSFNDKQLDTIFDINYLI